MSPRLTWSETSSKSARPAKDFESWETVSIAESAQCPLVRCPAQPSLACHAIAFGDGESRRSKRSRINTQLLRIHPFFQLSQRVTQNCAVLQRRIFKP